MALSPTSPNQFARIMPWPVWVAFTVALALNATIGGMRPWESPDTWRYEVSGRNLVAGNGYSSQAQPPYTVEILRSPGYPLLLAAIYAAFGSGRLPVSLAQALLLSLLVPLGYHLARRAFDDRTAVFTAWLTALFPYYWLFSGAILTEALAAFLLAALALLLELSMRRKSLWPVILAGLVLAWAALTKPILLPFVGVAALIYAWRLPWRAWLPRWLAMAVVTTLVIAPWMGYLWMRTGRIVPIAAGAGTQQYQMAQMMAHGYSGEDLYRYVVIPGAPVTRVQFATDPQEVLAIDDSLRAQAKDLIRAHPWLFLRHLAIAPFRMWLTIRVPQPGLLQFALVPLLFSVAVLGCGLLGMIVTGRGLRRAAVPFALIVYYSLAHAPLMVEGRFSFPVKLFMLMFVAQFLLLSYDRLRARRTGVHIPSDLDRGQFRS